MTNAVGPGPSTYISGEGIECSFRLLSRLLLLMMLLLVMFLWNRRGNSDVK